MDAKRRQKDRLLLALWASRKASAKSASMNELLLARAYLRASEDVDEHCVIKRRANQALLNFTLVETDPFFLRALDLSEELLLRRHGPVKGSAYHPLAGHRIAPGD